MWVLMYRYSGRWIDLAQFQNPNHFLLVLRNPTNVDPGVMQWDLKFMVRDCTNGQIYYSDSWCLEHRSEEQKGLKVNPMFEFYGELHP